MKNVGMRNVGMRNVGGGWGRYIRKKIRRTDIKHVLILVPLFFNSQML